MQTLVTLDDELVARAQEITGINERSALLTEALTRLVEAEAEHRINSLEDPEPNLQSPPQRGWHLDRIWGGSD